MKIEDLLHKLSDTPQCPRKSGTPTPGYKIKTSQSFGTFNQVMDGSNRSFVIGDDVTPQRKHQRLSMIDSELQTIEQMKNIYENKGQQRRQLDRSIDRSSGKRSSQKHNLKPSNTPSFPKFQKAKTKPNSIQTNLINSSLVHQNHQEQVKSRNNYLYPSNIEWQCQNSPNQQPYEEELTYEIHETFNRQPYISENKEFSYTESSNQQPPPLEKNYELSSRQRKKQSSKSSINVGQNSYLEQFYEFREKTQNRFDYVFNKIHQLEQQNNKLKHQLGERQISQIKNKQTIENLLMEKQMLIDENEKERKQKQELENILKDMLYKRQREKLQTSKENTQRDNERKSQYQQKRQEESSGNYTRKIPKNPSQSKMKVQNLLQKLQIRVDRS